MAFCFAPGQPGLLAYRIVPRVIKGVLKKMCEASAYVLKNGQEELLLSDVDIVEPDGDDLRLVNIFGEQKVARVAIHSL